MHCNYLFQKVGSLIGRYQHLYKTKQNENTLMTKASLVYTNQASMLHTIVLGLELRNPVIVASGMMTDTVFQINKAINAGAGAVVTKTIYYGRRSSTTEKIRHIRTGTMNSTTYSWKEVGQWLVDLATMQQASLPLIVSIHAETPTMLGELASRIADICLYPLELGISCPNDVTYSTLTPDIVYAYTNAVKTQVNVPISVKLTATESILDLAKAALDAGAEALSLSDTLPAIVLHQAQPLLLTGGIAGYSGPGIKPIVLHSIYRLREAGLQCPILGIGGVENANDVLDYIHLGASAVQMHTALMHSGVGLVGEIVTELSDWCTQHQTQIVNQIGRAFIANG
jgi:dihydroorotate dehydrogenase subfamily 1